MPLFNVRLSDEQLKKLSEIASSYNITKTALIEMWIARWHPRVVRQSVKTRQEEVLLLLMNLETKKGITNLLLKPWSCRISWR